MTKEALLAKAQAVVASVGAEPIGFDGKPLHVTASVGVGLVPTDRQTPEEVVSIVDAALYEAKRLGRNRVAAAAQPRALQAVA
jgi:diguanylate cyclase (GGDEF)-like protein